MKLLLLFTLLSFSLASKELKIYKFKVGAGDSQLILFPSGYSILIDAGEPTGAKGEAGVNGKYLAKRLYKILGMKKVDVFVLTHYHWDHHGGYKVGGIWYLIEKAGFSFGKFIKRNIGSYNGEKLTDCNKNNIKWLYVGPMGNAEAKFVCYATSSKDKTKLSKIGEHAKRCSTSQIHPPDNGAEVKIIIRDALGVKDEDGKKLARNSMKDEHPVAENDFSMCLRIQYGKFVYITCGDLSGYTKGLSTRTFIYHDIETSVAPMVGEVDLMHINHHGTATSTNPTWCNTLKPTVAVSSCSDIGNGVAAKVLKNLKKVNAVIYTTGLAGKTKDNEDYKDVIRMNDDVVIKVPENGKEFTVCDSKGKNKKTYKIKQNKAAPVKCHNL